VQERERERGVSDGLAGRGLAPRGDPDEVAAAGSGRQVGAGRRERSPAVVVVRHVQFELQAPRQRLNHGLRRDQWRLDAHHDVVDRLYLRKKPTGEPTQKKMNALIEFDFFFVIFHSIYEDQSNSSPKLRYPLVNIVCE